VIIHDRLTGHTILAAANTANGQINPAQSLAVIASDGRSVAFNTDSSTGGQAAFLFNRVLNNTEQIPFQIPIHGFNDMRLSLSSGARFIAIISPVNNALFTSHILIFDQQTGTTKPVALSEIAVQHALSGDGHFLVIVSTSDNETYNLYRHELQSSETQLLADGIQPGTASISPDGSVIAYIKEVEGLAQVFVWDARGGMPPSYIVAGRVTDATDHPLALVTLEDGSGNTVKTDGEGYFYINGISPGPVTLVPFKEGYNFWPAVISLDAQSDTRNAVFVYAHDKVLNEAQLDIGMPYSFERGGSGPFHGFSAGYCTDLVLDAYTWGVDFSIQFALEQDFRAHPWHFYRWRDARNAHDMWRYFSYSGQMLPHEMPYQPGDIVFFDWSEDGEIDHVSVVSEVRRENRPAKMYAATGVIASNPGGLATELPWKPFHERTVRGHARWSGKYEPVIPSLPTEEVLQIALGGMGVEIRLLDAQGQPLSRDETEIPGGRCGDWVWEQSLSVTGPFASGSYYLVVISNPGETESPYQFIAQFIEDGLVTGRVELKGSLPPGEIGRFPLLLRVDEDGEIRLELGQSVRKIEGALGVRG